MITDFVLGFVMDAVTAILSLVPSWSLPTFQPHTLGGSNIKVAVAIADLAIPINDVAVILGLALVFSAGMFLWHAVVWTYEHIPAKAT